MGVCVEVGGACCPRSMPVSRAVVVSVRGGGSPLVTVPCQEIQIRCRRTGEGGMGGRARPQVFDPNITCRTGLCAVVVAGWQCEDFICSGGAGAS